MDRNDKELWELRNRIVDIALIVFSVVAVLALLQVIYSYLNEGFNFLFLAQVVIILVLVVLTLLRKKLSVILKTMVFVVLLTTIALFENIYWGVMSSAEIYIVLVILFVFGFLALRRTLIVYSFYLLAFLTVGYLYHKGVLNIPGQYNRAGFSSEMIPWLAKAIHLSIVVFAAVFAFSWFNEAYTGIISSLKKSEARYRSLSEVSNTGIWHLNNQGYTELVNPAMLRILDADSEEEIKDIHFTEFFHSTSKKIVEKETDSIMKGNPSTFEAVIEGRRGSVHTVMVSVVPLLDENNNVQGSIGSYIDISELKQTERDLKISRDSFEYLFVESPVPMMMISPDLKIIGINHRMNKVMGYSMENIPNADAWWLAAYPDAEYRAYARQVWKNALEDSKRTGKKVQTSEMDIAFADGSVHSFFVSVALSDHYFLFTFIDTTEIRATRKELEFERSQLLSIFESMENVIYITDPLTYEVLFINEALRSRLPDDPVGKKCYIGFQGLDAPCPFCTNEIILDQKPLPYLWEYHNPVINRTYSIVDRIIKWPDGRDVRFEIATDITEVKKAQTSLAASEKRFREMAEMLPQIVFETDLNGFFTYINMYGQKLFNITENSAEINRDIYSVVESSDHSRLSENFDRIAKGEATGGNEYLMKESKGRIFPALVYSSPIVEDGKTRGIRGVIIDITDRKRAEESLRESEQRFRGLVDNMTDPVLIVTFDGIIVFSNPAARHMITDDDTQEINGRSMLDFLKEDSVENAMTNLQKVKDSGGPSAGDYQIVTTKGEVLWIEASGTRVVFNQVEADLITIRNITARKKAEQELRESERWFRDVVDLTPYAVTIVDMEGRLLVANKKFLQDTGLCLDDIVGKPLDQSGISMDQDFVAQVKKDIIERGGVENKEVTIRSKENTLMDILYSCSIIRMNNEPGIITTTINISDKKRLERDLEKSREHLEDLVQERTEELAAANEELLATNDELYRQSEELKNILDALHKTQDKLIESEKMASLGVLASGISHEINNPLNFIQGGIYSIEDYLNNNLQAHKDELVPLFNMVNEGVRRASDIVSSLNHFSRKTESQNERCDVHLILDNCLHMLHNQIKNRIEVQKYYNAGELVIQGNEGKLHQALLNVISNAEQASEDRGKISITTEGKDNEVIITIADTGYGIGPENLNKIFDPFFTTKDPGKGTGLGLSITYNIIRDHKGDITIHSELNEGTTVIIKLPYLQ